MDQNLTDRVGSLPILYNVKNRLQENVLAVYMGLTAPLPNPLLKGKGVGANRVHPN